MSKYYLRVEVRYSYEAKGIFDNEDGDRVYVTDKVHSDLFDTEKECIDYGNKIINSNKWMEQFPGYVGQKLDRRFGRPSVSYTIKKTRAVFYISVEELKVVSALDIDAFLNKFDIDKITKRL